jgi:maleylacetoacetate isomerase
MTAPSFKLYSYWRSSCSYRVRIALNLKCVPYDIVPVHLLRDGGQQHNDAYRRLNPLGVVPALVDGDYVLSQSPAIFQYLEARVPDPALVPFDLKSAGHMWALVSIVACDTQPLQNLTVLQYLERTLGHGEAARNAWAQHWIERGLDAFESLLDDGPFCIGSAPTYADCALIPQLANAARYGLDIERWPRIARVARTAADLPAFKDAHPSRQPDAEA